MVIHVKNSMIFIAKSLLLKLVYWFNLCNIETTRLVLAVIMLY